MTGKNAKVVGDDNAKDGVGRVVNVMKIQSKYCATGSRCINECFRNDEFRYYLKDANGNYIRDSNGLHKPMQIEVPSDDETKLLNNQSLRACIRAALRGQVQF